MARKHQFEYEWRLPESEGATPGLVIWDEEGVVWYSRSYKGALEEALREVGARQEERENARVRGNHAAR